MNKKMLWIGILVLVVLGLVVVGKTLNRPAQGAPAESTLEASDTGDAINGTAGSSSSTGAAATGTAQPAPKAPPKVAAKPSSSIAASNAMPETIMLDLSGAFARAYQDRLERFISQPADFDQYYVVAKWPCDTSGCSSRAGVIDKRNGKAYLAPSDNLQSKQPGPWFVPYSINSNLYRIINNEVIETYSFDGIHFTLVNVEDF